MLSLNPAAERKERSAQARCTCRCDGEVKGPVAFVLAPGRSVFDRAGDRMTGFELPGILGEEGYRAGCVLDVVAREGINEVRGHQVTVTDEFDRPVGFETGADHFLARRDETVAHQVGTARGQGACSEDGSGGRKCGERGYGAAGHGIDLPMPAPPKS